MAQAYVGQKRIRRSYGNIREVLEMPNLIEVQKSSYDLFLNSGEGEGHKGQTEGEPHCPGTNPLGPVVRVSSERCPRRKPATRSPGTGQMGEKREKKGRKKGVKKGVKKGYCEQP